MRLFLAVEIPDDVRRAVTAWTASLRRALEDAGGGFRWVAAENLHLTVHFIGEVDERVEASTRASLGTTLPLAPFDIALQGIGAFPHRGPVQVIWLGVTAGADRLAELYALTGRRLQSAGVTLDSRPYSAHLTLARARGRRQRRAGRGGAVREILHGVPTAPGGKADAATPVVPLTWRADHATLYQSDLSSGAPRYTPRARLAFGLEPDPDQARLVS